jgi:hypothetical protein
MVQTASQHGRRWLRYTDGEGVSYISIRFLTVRLLGAGRAGEGTADCSVARPAQGEEATREAAQASALTLPLARLHAFSTSIDSRLQTAC